MPELPDFSAVIFDLDGLVLDTESTYFSAWQQASGLMGHDCSEAFCRSLSGLQFTDIEQRLLAAFGNQFNLQVFRTLSTQAWRELVAQQGIAVKPGFRQLLAALKKLRLPFALATNSPQVNALECLTLAGLENTFANLIARDHVRAGKPEPDIYLQAAQQLQTPIRHCLVLEDSYNGVLSAHRAGASVIYVPSGLPSAEAGLLSTRSVENLNQVAQLIEYKFS
ncbi:MAG: HAD family phosphatase [Methylococcales bacterium]